MPAQAGWSLEAAWWGEPCSGPAEAGRAGPCSRGLPDRGAPPAGGLTKPGQEEARDWLRAGRGWLVLLAPPSCG